MSWDDYSPHRCPNLDQDGFQLRYRDDFPILNLDDHRCLNLSPDDFPRPASRIQIRVSCWAES